MKLKCSITFSYEQMAFGKVLIPPTKPRTKYRVPWETLAVREKCVLVKTASKSYRKNPTNTNARKLEKAQYQLAGIYLKEQSINTRSDR